MLFGGRKEEKKYARKMQKAMVDIERSFLSDLNTSDKKIRTIHSLSVREKQWTWNKKSKASLIFYL